MDIGKAIKTLVQKFSKWRATKVISILYFVANLLLPFDKPML